jgi:hypothetical protein
VTISSPGAGPEELAKFHEEVGFGKGRPDFPLKARDADLDQEGISEIIDALKEKFVSVPYGNDVC